MNKGYFYIILTTFIFSTMEIATKLIISSLNPYQLIFIRFLIGGLMLLPFALVEFKKRNLTFTKSDFIYFLITGFLCVVVSMTFFQMGVMYSKASTSAVVFSTNPVFTVPFACLILNEKINTKTVISIVVSIIGLVFILNPFNLSPDFKGIICSAIAAITFSLYGVVGKLKMDKFGGLIITCFAFLFGDLMYYVGLLFLKIPTFSGINSSNILSILYISIVVTGIGYLTYFLAIKETSVVAASSIFFIKPALAPVLSLIILKETIHLNTIAGIAFILAGALIMFQGKKASEEASV